MKIAIFDLGTNTFNLLIRETESEETLYSTKLPVKLSEAGILEKKISQPAFARGMEVLKQFRQELEKWKVSEVYVFATSAIRDAANREEFIAAAKEEFGFHINLINGLEEAGLIHKGVSKAVDLSGKVHLIVDIGGGSTEFIFAEGQNIHWKKSYRLGSGRLLEKFQPSDPITQPEIKTIQKYLGEELEDLIKAQKEYRAQCLVGSSGSFETIAEMILINLYQKEHEPQSGFYFKEHDYQKIADRMIHSTLNERLETRGMLAMRADMMVVAVLLINFIRQTLRISEMKLSNYALKEGVFYSIKENKNQWLKSSS